MEQFNGVVGSLAAGLGPYAPKVIGALVLVLVAWIGSRLVRTGGFPGTVVGTDAGPDLSAVLDQVVSRDYPTWTAGLSVSYPVGKSAQDAAAARARRSR